jgi:hypothetical protein
MKKILICLSVIIIFFINLTTVSAQNTTQDNTGGTQTTQNNSAPCSSGACQLTNPLGSVSTPQAFIGIIINSILGLVGSIALLMFIYGGLTWMTSSGNPEKVKKGRDIILWSAIGLLVIFSAYGLTRFILATVVK